MQQSHVQLHAPFSHWVTFLQMLEKKSLYSTDGTDFMQTLEACE